MHEDKESVGVIGRKSGGIRRTPDATRMRWSMVVGEAFGVRGIPALLQSICHTHQWTPDSFLPFAGGLVRALPAGHGFVRSAAPFIW